MPVVREIDATLDKATIGLDQTDPFQVSLWLALDLLKKIESTLLLEKDLGYDFDWEAARAALEYMSGWATTDRNRGQVWCLIRKDRNLSRFQPALGSPYFSDSPDTAQREGVVARAVAIENPMLILIRQNGQEELDWKGTSFYWPVIIAPANTRVSIFAHETTP